MIDNLPMTIPYDGYLELRGECVVSWKNFHKINEGLAEPYSHPRNLAAGSLRNLDTNITKQRNLSYVVFECVSDLYDEINEIKANLKEEMNRIGQKKLIDSKEVAHKLIEIVENDIKSGSIIVMED